MPGQVGLVAEDEQWYAFHRWLFEQDMQFFLSYRKRFLIGRVDDVSGTSLATVMLMRKLRALTLWRSLLGSNVPTSIESAVGHQDPSFGRSAVTYLGELHFASSAAEKNSTYHFKVT